MTRRVAVDIGGTFTDAVVFDEDTRSIRAAKTLTTPEDLVEGIFFSFEGASVVADGIATLVHGSTIVINALIERRGAHAALVTTEGFRDVYEIGRINRPDSFNLHFGKHVPLIGRDLVYEVPERVDADGAVVAPMDENAARAVVRELVTRRVDAIGVVFLHAYRNPVHETLMRQIIAEEAPHCFVTLSHELTREYREFERTSTTAANTYVGPIVSEYLDRLEGSLAGDGFTGTITVMQSNGGVSDLATARRHCIQMMESGPSGGVVGAAALCASTGVERGIAFDMGGTTAKASVVDPDGIGHAPEYFVGGYEVGLPVRIPVVDIVEVGTGGGSVAWLDQAGGLHVGPRSAGARPGPSCYGLGGIEATVTDAAVVLGHLDPGGSLSGGLRLDASAARDAVAKVGDPLGMTVAATAMGIQQIAASAMADAVRAVTTERGLDPRDFSLICYGGSGPLHASFIASELGMRRVVVPPHAAVFSALGMLLADVRRDYVVTGLIRLAHTPTEELEARYQEIEAEGKRELLAMGTEPGGVSFRRQADMRYVGQEHTVTVELGPFTEVKSREEAKAAFDEAHQRLYGHSAWQEEAEIVSIRLSALGRTARPTFERVPPGGGDPGRAQVRERKAVFDRGGLEISVPVYDRSLLGAGDRIEGPAFVEEAGTTTVARPGEEINVGEYGSLDLVVGP